MEHLIYGCRGKGTKPAESYHTAGRGQQEAYQAMLHKGTQSISSMSQTKHKMALGLINTGLPRLRVVLNTCLHYPTNRVQNNKYIFNETLTPEYKEKTENGLVKVEKNPRSQDLFLILDEIYREESPAKRRHVMQL